MALREITFGINRYKRPRILSERESLPNVIKNILFMVPKNLPGNPKKGGDVFQYLWKTEDGYDERKIEAALKEGLGDSLYDNYIDTVRLAIEPIGADGSMVMLVSVQVRIMNESTGVRERELLTILFKKTADNHVHYNYKYISDSLKNL